MKNNNFLNRIIISLFQKNISVGYLYFYIHFVTEVICFYTLSKLIGDSIILWIIPFLYDSFAFVPQSIIGYINDKHLNINFSMIGLILLLIGFSSFMLNIFSSIFISIIILCLGNACIHVRGAEITLRNSLGNLSHSAIFVSGGSFGVITGKLLASNKIPFYYLLLLGLTAIPFILLAECYNNKKNRGKKKTLVIFN